MAHVYSVSVKNEQFIEILALIIYSQLQEQLDFEEFDYIIENNNIVFNFKTNDQKMLFLLSPYFK